MAAFLERFQQRHNRAVPAVLEHELCDLRVVAGLQVVQQPHHLVEPPRLDGLGVFAALVVALAALAVPLLFRDLAAQLGCALNATERLLEIV